MQKKYYSRVEGHAKKKNEKILHNTVSQNEIVFFFFFNSLYYFASFPQ